MTDDQPDPLVILAYDIGLIIAEVQVLRGLPDNLLLMERMDALRRIEGDLVRLREQVEGLDCA